MKLQENHLPRFRPLLKANFVNDDQKRKEAFDLSMTLQHSIEPQFYSHGTETQREIIAGSVAATDYVDEPDVPNNDTR